MTLCNGRMEMHIQRKIFNLISFKLVETVYSPSNSIAIEVEKELNQIDDFIGKIKTNPYQD